LIHSRSSLGNIELFEKGESFQDHNFSLIDPF
jgi:hypothetical protein